MVPPNDEFGRADRRRCEPAHGRRLGRQPTRLQQLVCRGTEMEGLFALGAVAVLLGLTLWWHFGRSSSLLHQWAEKNGFRIVRQEYRSFFKDPFFWTSSKGQTVYYVVVEDSAGTQRSGWVRCGGWWLGLLSDNVEVRWDA
jgi:hypothetical protein